MTYLPVVEYPVIAMSMCAYYNPWEFVLPHLSVKPCAIPLKAIYLCEENSWDHGSANNNSLMQNLPDVHKPKAAVHLNIPSDLPKKSDYQECPGKHFTHAFLACDALASCWAGNDVEFQSNRDLWDVPSFVSCPAPLTSLPPSFSCTSGRQRQVQRVPYSLVCDGRSDCSGNGDEDFCVFPRCTGNTPLRCRNGNGVRHG